MTPMHYKRMKVVINAYLNSLKPLSEMRRGIPNDWLRRIEFQKIRLTRLRDYLIGRALRHGFKI